MPRCSLFSAKIHNIAGIIEENQQINAIEIGIQVVRRISRKLGRGLKSVPKRIADSERLKNLSTTLSYKVEAKGKDRDEIGFFAKFVLCSNNEHLPVISSPSSCFAPTTSTCPSSLTQGRHAIGCGRLCRCTTTTPTSCKS